MKRSVKVISFALVLVLCMGLLGTFASAAVVKKGSSGTEVRQVQYNLNVLGFNCGAVDGVCGNNTVAQIKKYQKSRGLEVDGMAGPATQSKLKTEVKEIQNLLKKHGCYSDTVDGIAGPNTIAGVKKFQDNKGIKPANGVVNSETLTALKKPVSNPSTLKIGSGNYKPGTLMQGSSYSISGNITSNYKITSVTVGVYNSNGKATAQVKTVKPNATSYNINKVDNNIKFGSLSAGTYYFKVIAKDASGGKEKVLVNNQFTVKKPPEPTQTKTMSSSFANSVYSVAHNQKGMKHSRYTGYKTAPEWCEWCGYYARWVLNEAYKQMGKNSKDYIPYDSMTGACNIHDQFKTGKYGGYYNFTNWEYDGSAGKKTSNLSSCKPKVGDIILVETNGDIDDGPDHIAIVIKAYSDGSFIASEGNTTYSDNNKSFVSEHKYVKKNGIWQRESMSWCKVHTICSIKTP